MQKSEVVLVIGIKRAFNYVLHGVVIEAAIKLGGGDGKPYPELHKKRPQPPHLRGRGPALKLQGKRDHRQSSPKLGALTSPLQRDHEEFGRSCPGQETAGIHNLR